jgi:hypothetical protein
MHRHSAARQLDFGGTRGEDTAGTPIRRALAMARKPASTRGPAKYAELDLKRRRAQIRARRLLGLV